MLSQEFLFFFSALGAFHGLLFGAYLLLTAPRTLSRRLLGAFVLMLSVRVGKSVIFYFNRDLAREYLQLGLTACLFIGPLLYFFVRSLDEPADARFRRRLWTHLGPLLLLALVGGMLFSYRAYPEVWRGGLIDGIYAIWLGYGLAAARAGRARFRRLLPGGAPATARDRLVAFTVAGSLLLVLLYIFASFTHYISGALAFTLLLYASWAALPLFRHEPPPPKDRPALLDEETATRLTDRLTRVMAEERPHLNPNLKLAELASAIRCTPHQLSALLNDRLGKSFSQFVGEHRVATAEALLATSDHLTLEAIGQSSGFNARSTFYAVFRRVHGTTPAEYRKRLKVS